MPNGSFENGDIKRLKAYGQLEEMYHRLVSLHGCPARLFIYGCKERKGAVPATATAMRMPSDGNRYGGFRAYSKVPKLRPTYFQVRLGGNLRQESDVLREFRHFAQRFVQVRRQWHRRLFLGPQGEPAQLGHCEPSHR